MKHTLTKYRFTCDWCRAQVFLEDYDRVSQPEGWGYREVHDCGLTGYTRRDLVCPACLAKP